MIEGSYDIETLATISKFSSDIWGDIRVAIKLLEKTAIITEMLGKDKISEEIIKEAIKELQMSEIDKVFPTLPRHLRWVVVALWLESEKIMVLKSHTQTPTKPMVYLPKRSDLARLEIGDIDLIWTI